MLTSEKSTSQSGSVQPLVLHKLSGLRHDKAEQEDSKSQTNGRGVQDLSVVVLGGVGVDVLTRLRALTPRGKGWQRASHSEAR